MPKENIHKQCTPLNDPNLFQLPSKDSVHRLVVIDGCNIGRASCGPSREAVNGAGLLAIVRFLLVRDFDVVVFVPIIYNNDQNSHAIHADLLQKMESLGLLSFTSARTAHGKRRAFINYDDLYALELAERHGGCVLSGDHYTDILKLPQYRSYHEIVRSRRISVRFNPLGQDFLSDGIDRFYKSAPQLFIEAASYYSSEPERLRPRLFSRPSDPEYQRSLNRRKSNWSEKRRDVLLRAIDDAMDELESKISGIRPPVPPIRFSSPLNDPDVPGPSGIANAMNRRISVAEKQGHKEPAKKKLLSLGDEFETFPSDDYKESYLAFDGDQKVPSKEELVARWLSPAMATAAPLVDLSSIASSLRSPKIGVPANHVLDAALPCVSPPRERNDRAQRGPPPAAETASTSATATVASVDSEVEQIVKQLAAIFPESVIRQVLKDNASRNLDVLAGLCADHCAQS